MSAAANSQNSHSNQVHWKALISKRMGINFFLGFSSGMPLLLTGSTLQAWMTDAQVDLTVIGIFSLVGLPYSLKFIWAPAMDWVVPSFLGRRRGWLFCLQLALAIAILLLSQSNPAANPVLLALIAVLVTFFSASQDIVADAYRRESLADRELGWGTSLFVNGYRIGMLVAGAFALFLADQFSWETVYFLMASLMTVGLITTLVADEPKVHEKPPINFKQAVLGPFQEFFSRKSALLFLAFILFYKLGDSMASHMFTPFILGHGYTKTEYAAVAKTFGLFATIGGGLIGGALLLKLGIQRSLWIFGILQAISTAGFSILSTFGHHLGMLTAVVAFENLSSGMGTAAYAAFMASLTNKKFTATQYALLSSLMGVPRVIAAAPTGWLAEQLGWFSFFLMCTIIAIPGLILLVRIQKLAR